jgi:hypothetical protein
MRPHSFTPSGADFLCFPFYRFVTRTDAGFGFLSVFLEVLVRRAKLLYKVEFYASKVFV